jgi:hypothetical protein
VNKEGREGGRKEGRKVAMDVVRVGREERRN